MKHSTHLASVYLQPQYISPRKLEYQEEDDRSDYVLNFDQDRYPQDEQTYLPSKKKSLDIFSGKSMDITFYLIRFKFRTKGVSFIQDRKNFKEKPFTILNETKFEEHQEPSESVDLTADFHPLHSQITQNFLLNFLGYFQEEHISLFLISYQETLLLLCNQL